MGLINRFFGGAEAAVSRVSGRTDLLEGACAGAALAAAADGNIDEGEIGMAIQIVTNNEILGKAFNDTQINECMNKQIKRANGGYSGKAALWKEIEDVTKDPQDAEVVFLICLDVVHHDGDVGEKEQEFLNKLAGKLKIDPKKYA